MPFQKHNSVLKIILIIVGLKSSDLSANNVIKAPSDIQLCRYRDVGRMPQPIYTYFTSWGCYDFTRSDLFEGGKLAVSACSVEHANVIYSVPGIQMDLNTSSCIPFHHDNEKIAEIVLASFGNERSHLRWLNCCTDAQQCCENILSNAIEKANHCVDIWDGWSCIASVPAKSMAQQVCSPYSYSNQPPRCHHFSSKECFSDAEWNVQTDYSTCSITPRLKERSQWHISLLSISIIVAAPALLILICYHGPQLQKLQLIRNLLAALWCRNLLILMTSKLIVLDELTSISDTAMSNNDWPCKMLAVFEKLATNAVFTCMLLEGIFLHQLLTNVFANRGGSGPKMLIFHIIGCGVSVGCALAWSIVMALQADEHCWIVTDANSFHWINDAPRLLMLLTCCVLLAHLAYRLWRSLRNTQNEHTAALRTAKALMLCMPLFGIPFLAFIVHPDTDSCAAEQAYYIVYYIFESLQVIAIAVCHCYTDREVKKFILNGYAHLHDRLQWNTVRTSRSERRSFWSNVGRRGTDTTTVDAKHDSISSMHSTIDRSEGTCYSVLAADDHDAIADTLPGIHRLDTVQEKSENIHDTGSNKTFKHPAANSV